MKKLFLFMFIISIFYSLGYTESFSSLKYHFSFTIPNGWKEIPKIKIDEKTKESTKATGTKFIDYIAGFQEADKTDFTYPYMLINYHDLQGYKITWDFFKSEFGKEDFVESGFNGKEYRAFIKDFELSSPLIDSSKKIIIHNVEADIVSVGIIRGIIIFYLGKDGILQLNMFIPKKEYNKYTSVIINIIDTLKFDYGYSHSGIKYFREYILS